MLTLGILTDVHFGPQAHFGGKLRKLTEQGPPLTKAFVQRMKHEVKPDLIVNLGDVIEDESAAADAKRYHAFLDLLRAADCEVVSVAGNHDCVHLSAEQLRRAWGLSAEGVLYRSLDRGGIHLVTLYSHERKDRDIQLGSEQLDWLERDLAATELPTVVLVHHSAADQDLRGNRWFEGLPHICLIDDRERLRALLEQHGRTLVVVNGHLHWNHLDVINGIPYITVQSLIENVEDDAPGVAAAAHAVVRIEGMRVSVEIAGAQPCRYQFDRGALSQS